MQVRNIIDWVINENQPRTTASAWKNLESGPARIRFVRKTNDATDTTQFLVWFACNHVKKEGKGRKQNKTTNHYMKKRHKKARKGKRRKIKKMESLCSSVEGFIKTAHQVTRRLPEPTCCVHTCVPELGTTYWSPTKLAATNLYQPQCRYWSEESEQLRKQTILAGGQLTLFVQLIHFHKINPSSTASSLMCLNFLNCFFNTQTVIVQKLFYSGQPWQNCTIRRSLSSTLYRAQDLVWLPIRAITLVSHTLKPAIVRQQALSFLSWNFFVHLFVSLLVSKIL